MRMRGVMAALAVVLFITGCGSDHPGSSATNQPPGATPSAAPPPEATPPGATPPTVLQVDFPQTPFNTVTGESPQYQATQELSATPQQSVMSQRYVMTISMF